MEHAVPRESKKGTVTLRGGRKDLLRQKTGISKKTIVKSHRRRIATKNRQQLPENWKARERVTYKKKKPRTKEKDE